MEFDLSVVGLSLDNIFDCFRVWPFFRWWLSFIYSSRLIMLVVVSIYKIIVSLELVLLKIWSELVAFTWRVMGGAILQLIVLSAFLIALRCRNIAWYLLILQFDPAFSNRIFFFCFVLKSELSVLCGWRCLVLQIDPSENLLNWT